MQKKEIFFVWALTAAALTVSAAWGASKTKWDGDWVGTSDGQPVDVTISGPSVSAVQYRGQNVNIFSSEVSPKTVVFSVGPSRKFTMIRTGENSASFRYTAPDGHSEGRLTRK